MKRRCKIHGCVVCVALPRFVWCVFVVVFYTSAVFLGSSALHFGVFPPSSTIGPFHSCTSSNGPSESAHEQKVGQNMGGSKNQFIVYVCVYNTSHYNAQ